MPKQKLLSQKEYAAHLGVSQQAVNRMIHTGKIPSIHGKIDPVAADLALAPSDAASGAVTLAEAQRRKELALAGLRELELQRKRGEVVEVSYVEQCLVKMHTNVRARLLAIPSKLTPRLLGVVSPAKVKAILEREVNETCQELVEIAGKVD